MKSRIQFLPHAIGWDLRGGEGVEDVWLVMRFFLLFLLKKYKKTGTERTIN